MIQKSVAHIINAYPLGLGFDSGCGFSLSVVGMFLDLGRLRAFLM